MRLVIDASAAVNLASMPTGPDLAGRLELIAPPLMWSEGVSAILAAAFRGDLPDARLYEAIERLESMPINAMGGDPAHRRRSVEIARNLGWAKSYDAEYLALAEALGCPVLTIDQRLIRRARSVVRLVEPSELLTS